MAEAISDKQVVAVLRPFIRATAPVVDALREADPFGLRERVRRADSDQDDFAGVQPSVRDKLLDGLASVKVPGTAAWARMNPQQRVYWWVHRVGRLTSLVTAVPGLGGALADRLPIQDTLGAASQGVLLSAIAGEYGVQDLADRVRLVAWVLFDRDIDRDLADGKHADHDSAAEDAATAELTEELTAATKKHGKATVKSVFRTLWRLGRSLLGITEELEKRPHGRFYHQALGMLPVVGMVGDYLGERSGLRRVAKRAEKWFATNAGR